MRETKYLGLFNILDVNDFYFSYEIDLTQHTRTTIGQLINNNGVKEF